MGLSTLQLLGRLAGVAVLVIATWTATRSPELFEFERGHLLSGEWWRLWTGHFVHRTTEHLHYDLGVAVVLAACFGGAWRLFLWAPLLSLLLLWCLPDLQAYYGLSGLLHGWVVYEAGRIALKQAGHIAWVGVGLCLGVLAKAGFEAASGHSCFTDPELMGGVVIYGAHLVGALLGMAALALLIGRTVVPALSRSRRSAEARDGGGSALHPHHAWMGLVQARFVLVEAKDAAREGVSEAK